jgi:hypothetical protein
MCKFSDGSLCVSFHFVEFWFCGNKIHIPLSLFLSIPIATPKNAYTGLDIESEPPPEPAPPELFPPSHRDISMASINAITIKQPSNFVLKIDKNGDQIHEEFIPHSQHGKSSDRWMWKRFGEGQLEEGEILIGSDFGCGRGRIAT